MKTINHMTIVKNLKKNFPLLCSFLAAMCLFFSPTLVSLVFIIVVFIAIMVAASLGLPKIPLISNRFLKSIGILLALSIAFIGYNKFQATWFPSSKVAALANALHLSAQSFLSIIGLLGCLIGFYSMYTISCQLFLWVYKLLPEKRKVVIITNLKKNWFFPISAVAFYCLNLTMSFGYIIGILIAFITAVIFFSQIPPIFPYAKENHLGLNVISMLTGVGICLRGSSNFYAHLKASSFMQKILSMFSISFDFDVTRFISISVAVFSIAFVYFFTLILWKKIIRIFSETGVFSNIKTVEWIIYGILLITSIGMMAVSFFRTQVFYGTAYPYDIIYTSDSPSLVKGNAYLALTHPENDLRQPLFAVFAAPFTAVPYLIGVVTGANATVRAILLNGVQVIMLYTANFILTRMMRLNSKKRVCFMLIASCTYTQMLFILMMEQYIVAYFWLILCVYLICEKRQYDRIALWGAGGTLLTSLILLPFMSEESPVKNIKGWLIDMVRHMLGFVALMLMFCRFDVIINFNSKIYSLSGFAGMNLTIMNKLHQYTEYIRYCFVAPNAGVNTMSFGHISWQLYTATNINTLGILIMFLVIISAIVNRDKKCSLLAIGWVVFSIIVLVFLGWGTKENGLILYALYFGWAFLVLLFQLIEKIESKLNTNFVLPASICFAAMLAYINIPAIMEMLNFAITYYPV